MVDLVQRLCSNELEAGIYFYNLEAILEQIRDNQRQDANTEKEGHDLVGSSSLSAAKNTKCQSESLSVITKFLSWSVPIFQHEPQLFYYHVFGLFKLLFLLIDGILFSHCCSLPARAAINPNLSSAHTEGHPYRRRSCSMAPKALDPWALPGSSSRLTRTLQHFLVAKNPLSSSCYIIVCIFL